MTTLIFAVMCPWYQQVPLQVRALAISWHSSLTAAKTCSPRGLCTLKNCRYCLENICIKKTTLHGWNQYIVVGVATLLQADQSRVCFLSGKSEFLLLGNVQTASGALLVSYCFLWKLNSQDVKLTTDVHLVLRWQMSGALPLFLVYTLLPRRHDSCDKWCLCSFWVKGLKWNNITKVKVACQALYW